MRFVVTTCALICLVAPAVRVGAQPSAAASIDVPVAASTVAVPGIPSVAKYRLADLEALPPREIPPEFVLERELRAASSYAGWGGAAGIAGGLVAGVVQTRRSDVPKTFVSGLPYQ